MAIEDTLIRVITDTAQFADEHAENAFWVLFKERDGVSTACCEDLNLLKNHRPELAKKVAKEILEMVGFPTSEPSIAQKPFTAV